MYLEHHGILGMKWGVRKKKDTSDRPKKLSRREAKKLKKKQEAELRDRLGSVSDSILDETYAFDKTPYGKKLQKQYYKELDDMFDPNSDWADNKEKQNRFNKVEEKYLRSQQEYAARKVLEKYGEDTINEYKKHAFRDPEKDFVKLMSDEWWVHAV